MTELATVDAPAMGSCSECGQDLPDGGDLCDGCSMLRANQITPRRTPADLVAIYQQAERDIRQGFALIASATEALNAAFTLGKHSGISIQGHSNTHIEFTKPEVRLKEVRRAIWHTMVERLEVRRMMSVSAWKELAEQIDKGEVPDLTEEAIGAMVQQFSERAPAMLEQAVAEVFDFLRPPHSEYKRNSEYEVPRRVALTWVIDTWYTKTFPQKKLQPRHQCEQQLTALENVFSSLDGKGSTSKGHVSNLSEAIRQTERGALGETEYFAFRGYNNGALHLEFKRLDLLKKLNAIAGGSRLRSKGAA